MHKERHSCKGFYSVAIFFYSDQTTTNSILDIYIADGMWERIKSQGTF